MAIPASYNLRNLVVRKTTTIMTALGIALTVAVLLSVLALVGLVVFGLALAMISFDLSFFPPFLDHEVVYGAYLTQTGLLCVLGGLALGSATRPPAHQATPG